MTVFVVVDENTVRHTWLEISVAGLTDQKTISMKILPMVELSLIGVTV